MYNNISCYLSEAIPVSTHKIYFGIKLKKTQKTISSEYLLYLDYCANIQNGIADKLVDPSNLVEFLPLSV